MLRLPSSCFSRRGVAAPLTVPTASEGDMGSPGSEDTPSSADVSGDPKAASGISSKWLDMSGTTSIHRSRFFLQHDSSAALKDVYEIDERPLGKGGFGIVWRARLHGHAGLWNRAVKTAKKKHAEDCHKVRSEADIMKGLDHPHVCRVFETFEEPGCFHIVLELIDGKDLFEYVFERTSKGELLEEGVAATFTLQILEGLHYCHSQGIIHRDIKPDNIMVQNALEHTQPHIKIIDFGLAMTFTTLQGALSGTFHGTFAYAAPEVKLGLKHSAASDLWGVGMVVHALLLGGLPCDRVCSGEEPIPLMANAVYDTVSMAARELLHGLLQIEPKRRLTAARIEMTSENSWTNASCEDCGSPTRMSTSALESFTCFHQSSMFYKAVTTAMAMQVLETEPIQNIKDQFVAMDSDGNGCLSKSELSYALASQAHPVPTVAADIASWLEMVFAAIDTDGSGEIEYSEYLAAVLSDCSCRSDQAIQAAFRLFDVDGSGKISCREFARVITMLPEDIVKSIGELDADVDGEINLEEFRSIVANGHAVNPFAREPSSIDPTGRRLFKI